MFQNPDDQLVASPLSENDVAFGPENLRRSTDHCAKRVADALGDDGLQGFDKRDRGAVGRAV